ncbi:uncharacterized protein DUF1206 [Gillisia mitskevichiae]|uniref:Uncharacterized protein DUF1206 n=1 Tax=Gillisia mitskevichiae TaxID=270921 RepID=A0A495PWR9_9FLAO|nr:DUF1206 domain-containing protein [Gillisia mitskevichiae]RKS53199.1 uncharacterized protein DUF1206 [Gillisia mitskevichiae]
MNKKLKNIARTGLAAKGIIYGIIGILTFLAAFNMGGQKAGKLQVIDFLEKQTFGKILLVIIALGLLCYAFWKFTQAIRDPENIGTDKKSKAKRISYFISGIIYLGLGVFSFLDAVGSADNSGSSGKNSSFLATDVGLIVLGIVGVILIGIGIYQFTRIKEDTFEKKFSAKALSEKKRKKTIYNSAYFGLASRGVIFLILGFFAIKAAFTSNPSEIKTTAEVFSFLEDSSYGSYLLGIVAAGLIAYAIYTFMLAKYRRFN